MLTVLAQTASRNHRVLPEIPHSLNAFASQTSSNSTASQQESPSQTSPVSQHPRLSTSAESRLPQRAFHTQSAAATPVPTPNNVSQHRRQTAVHALSLSRQTDSNHQHLEAVSVSQHVVHSTSDRGRDSSVLSDSSRAPHSRLNAVRTAVLMPPAQHGSESLQRQRSFVACALRFRASCEYGIRAL